MAAHVAKSANRAHGLVISKYKIFGGLLFSTFRKLFDTIAWSTISYGAAIWDDREFKCINVMQKRGERYFMGVGRYTPNAAVNGDMGWDKPIIKQWSSVVNNWIKIKNMDDGRINKKIYKWAALNKGPSCKNSTYRLSKTFEESGIGYMFAVVDSNAVSKRFFKAEIQGRVRNETIEKRQQELLRNSLGVERVGTNFGRIGFLKQSINPKIISPACCQGGIEARVQNSDVVWHHSG